MYSKIEGAKEKYRQLINTNQNFWKIAGTHISNGILDAEDGLITDENHSSHFELYEFENVELQNKFNIIEKL